MDETIAHTVGGHKVRHVCSGYAVLARGGVEASDRAPGEFFVVLHAPARIFFVGDGGLTSMVLRAKSDGDRLLVLTDDGDVVVTEWLPFVKRMDVTVNYDELFGQMA